MVLATENEIRVSIAHHAGQVHRGKLKGQEIVVKVQRPGLKALFDIDLKNLRVSSTSLKLLTIHSLNFFSSCAFMSSSDHFSVLTDK